MSAAERLYTPELLTLTLHLAQYPWVEDLPLKGDARSKSCGSTLAMSLALDEDGKVERIGMRVQACAVGQASAAIFAAAAKGKDRSAIADAFAALSKWIAGEGDLPDWPGLEAIDAARAFPGRHGAMMLPWQAALAALSSEPASV